MRVMMNSLGALIAAAVMASAFAQSKDQTPSPLPSESPASGAIIDPAGVTRGGAAPETGADRTDSGVGKMPLPHGGRKETPQTRPDAQSPDPKRTSPGGSNDTDLTRKDANQDGKVPREQ